MKNILKIALAVSGLAFALPGLAQDAAAGKAHYATCIACHGPTGLGNPAASVPSVKGQYAVYAAQQLRNYASGARTSDGATRVMRDIAATLSEEDIVAVSAYMQGLQ